MEGSSTVMLNKKQNDKNTCEICCGFSQIPNIYTDMLDIGRAISTFIVIFYAKIPLH